MKKEKKKIKMRVIYTKVANVVVRFGNILETTFLIRIA